MFFQAASQCKPFFALASCSGAKLSREKNHMIRTTKKCYKIESHTAIRSEHRKKPIQKFLKQKKQVPMQPNPRIYSRIRDVGI